jgi:hypothetical protein
MVEVTEKPTQIRRVYTVTYNGESYLVRAKNPNQAITIIRRRIDRPLIVARMSSGEELYEAGIKNVPIIDDGDTEAEQQSGLFSPEDGA